MTNESVICCSNRLRSSHIPQRHDADADRRREDGPQGSEAGTEGRAGGEYIVEQDDVPYSSAVSEYRSGVFGDGECSGYVLGLFLDVELDLSLSAALSHKNIGTNGHSESLCSSPCYHFRLIVPSFPLPCPMQGDGNYHVNVRP